MNSLTKEYIADLAKQVSNGNKDAFRELEAAAQPLLRSLALKYSKYHRKFEYDDFYSIGLTSLYKACLSYKSENPSFFDYAKVIILREYWREIDYWNAGMRNVFINKEVYVDSLEEWNIKCNTSLESEVVRSDFRESIEQIIDDCFEEKKASILKMYLIYDQKVSDIAKANGLKYKYVHSTVTRGLDKIAQEYKSRFIDNTIEL